MDSSNRVGKDLTDGSSLEFRVSGGGTWHDSLEEALTGIVATRQPAPWPLEWVAFSTGSREDLIPDLSGVRCIPETLSFGGPAVKPTIVKREPAGVIDLAAVFGEAKARKKAVLFAFVDFPEPVTIHCGADWWMRWWVDGVTAFDTLEQGNRRPLCETPHEFSLTQGRHLLAVEVISGNGGWALASEATYSPEQTREEPFSLECRRIFWLEDPSEFSEFALEQLGVALPLLNGKSLTIPVQNMRYRSLTVSPSSFVSGANTLSLKWDEEQSRIGTRCLGLRVFGYSGKGKTLEISNRVVGFTAIDLRIQTGPIVSQIATDSMTVSCRTNLAAALRILLGRDSVTTNVARLHRVRFADLTPDTQYSLAIEPVGIDEPLVMRKIRTLPTDRPISFAIVGDPSPVPKTWRKVAACVNSLPVDFVIFLGDAVAHGRDDWRWDEEFFEPAAALFSRLPVMAVPGNHDESAPLFSSFFGTDDGPSNWSLRWNSALLLGLDGGSEWGPKSENRKWLERQLARNADAFLVVFDHYPPYSSTGHGVTDAEGQPVEPPMRTAREVIVPRMIQHGPGILVSGHAHCYERSELSPALTLVTSGGGGGYLYEQTTDVTRNPFSTVFESRHHYCVLTLESNACHLEARDLDGELIDRRDWSFSQRASEISVSADGSNRATCR